MKSLSLFIVFLASLGYSFSQKSIEALVNKTAVSANERFTFQIITNTDCPITAPNFGNLEVISGPSQSQSSSTRIVNGTISQSIEYSWTYQLRAKKEGNYTIPKVSMNCEEGVFETDVIKINVSKSQNNGSATGDFFMRLTSNKSSVYEGESFVVTLKYYSKIKPESFEALDLGDANGIWRQDLNPDRQSFQTNVENFNGVRYYSIELRQELCFAQRSGTVTLEPYFASLVFSRGFFNRFRKETNSNSLDIKVKQIPSNGQADFNGLVGDISLSSEISKSDVKIGEAIDLKIIIEGKGNMQALGNIELDFPDEFDQFDPEIVDKTTISSSGIKGEMEYNFVLIPKHYGNYTIPGFSFSYFDLKSEKMKKVSTEDFIITVDKRDGVDIDPPKVSVDPKELDIHYIAESESNLFERNHFLFGSWKYNALLSSPLLLSFLFIFLKRKKDNLSEEDRLKIQQKKAGKSAQNEFKLIREHIEKNEEKEALKLLQDTLLNFFKKKFNYGLSELSQRIIDTKLNEANIEQETRNSFNKIWSAIEMGQYAPIAHENLVSTVNETEVLISSLDKKI